MSFQIFQKFMKDTFMIKTILISINYFQFINAVSVKALTQHIFLAMIINVTISNFVQLF